MTFFANLPAPVTKLPDPTQLPESDGMAVFAQRLSGSQNFHKHSQSLLLQERQRAERVAVILSKQGIDPDTYAR